MGPLPHSDIKAKQPQAYLRLFLMKYPPTIVGG